MNGGLRVGTRYRCLSVDSNLISCQRPIKVTQLKLSVLRGLAVLLPFLCFSIKRVEFQKVALTCYYAILWSTYI